MGNVAPLLTDLLWSYSGQTPYSTVCVRLPLLTPEMRSPLYCPVMEWEPTASEDVVKVAWPEASMPVPRLVPPSENATVPVGVVARSQAALTVAARVTGCPNTEGFADELNTVLVK